MISYWHKSYIHMCIIWQKHTSNGGTEKSCSQILQRVFYSVKSWHQKTHFPNREGSKTISRGEQVDWWVGQKPESKRWKTRTMWIKKKVHLGDGARGRGFDGGGINSGPISDGFILWVNAVENALTWWRQSEIHWTQHWAMVSRIHKGAIRQKEDKAENEEKPHLNLGLPSPAPARSSGYELLVPHLRVKGFSTGSKWIITWEFGFHMFVKISHARFYLQLLWLPGVSVLKCMAEAGLAWTTTKKSTNTSQSTSKKCRTHQLQRVNTTKSLTWWSWQCED